MFTTESFYNGRIVMHGGDSREVVKTVPPNSVDSVVTDTPYALESIIKRFGAPDAAPALAKQTGAFTRVGAGFMGQKWDTGDVAHDPEFWRDVIRIVKPGGYVAAFGGDRTFHRLTTALETAGFEIRHTFLNVIDPDSPVVAFMQSLDEAQLGAFLRCMDDQAFGGLFAWMYGTGFPKSHDLSKGIDSHLFRQWLDADPSRRAAYREEMQAVRRLHSRRRAAAKIEVETKWRALGGFERKVVGKTVAPDGWARNVVERATGIHEGGHTRNGIGLDVTTAATGEAFQWQGWGTAPKPAFEPVVIARKPLSEETVAANVLRWRTGAINVDGCRVDGDDPMQQGRWPANVIHDGSDAVMDMFPITKSGRLEPHHDAKESENNSMSGKNYAGRVKSSFGGDTGSVGRFYYCAKANDSDRAGSKHPTIKPVSVKQFFVRLVTPPGGITLDPFAGTGTTAEAAVREGMRCILVEKEEKYRVDVRRRMGLIFAGPEERQRIETKPAPVETLPLFKEAKKGAQKTRSVPLVQAPDGKESSAPAPDARSRDPEITRGDEEGHSLPPVQRNQGQHDAGGVGAIPQSASSILAKLRAGLRPMVLPTITPGVFDDGRED